MPGPIVHRAAMQQCENLLKNANIGISVGRMVDLMVPDVGKHHGYDLDSSRGPLISNIEAEFNKIRLLFNSANKSLARVDREALSRHVQYLCHYTTDAHSVGQISREFWGRIDNRIDLRMEITTNKKALRCSLKAPESPKKAFQDLRTSMLRVYAKYGKKAGSKWFLVQKSVDVMCRECVCKGAEWAAALTYMALIAPSK